MPRKRSIPMWEHFWAKVDKDGPIIRPELERCWVWTAARRPAGYGTYYVNRYPYLAHRIAWELVFAPIPAGLSVLHKCDNPPCVNPEHLFLGSASDNVRDAISKGRFPSGIRITACRNCGRMFEAKIRHRRSYCCAECHTAGVRKRTNRLCEQCGRGFTVTDSGLRYTAARFCSLPCYRASVSYAAFIRAARTYAAQARISRQNATA